MNDDDVLEDVRRLRERGLSPKEIARVLGVRPAAVADLVRTLAAQRAAGTRDEELLRCWVSPGWSVGLTIDGDHPEWSDDGPGRPQGSGLVLVLVARAERFPKVSVCGYLLDVYCLGVKDALGPQRMHERDLPAFRSRYFGGYGAPPAVASADLTRHLVFGALHYARTLGFGPHPDFQRARRHLDPWSGPSAIRFGHNGKPHYTQGPYDDATSVLRTLQQSVGKDGYHFLVEADPRVLAEMSR